MRSKTSKSKGEGFLKSTVTLWAIAFFLLLALSALALKNLTPLMESDIEQRVIAALDDSDLKIEHIDVNGTDVILQGQIDSTARSEKAEEIVASVYGVSRIDNQLHVAGDARNTRSKTSLQNSYQQANPDLVASQTATDVGKKLTAPAKTTAAESWLVLAVKDDNIEVSGVVPNAATAERIYSSLSASYANHQLQTNLQVNPQVANPVWVDGLVAMIAELPELQNPGLSLSNERAFLSGAIGSEHSLDEKLSRIRSALGSGINITSELSVSNILADAGDSNRPQPVNGMPRLGSGKILLSTGDNAVAVTGIVGNEEEQDSIEQLADSAFGNMDYRLDLDIDQGVGATPDLPALFALASELKQLDGIQLGITNGKLQLSGELENVTVAHRVQASVEKYFGSSTQIAEAFKTVQIKQAGSSDSTADSETGSEGQAKQLRLAIAAIDSSKIEFENGRADPSPDSVLILEKIATAAVRFSEPKIEIAGHTDSSGNAFNNLDLSKKRADAVRDYLITRGVSADRLRATGYGETRPIANNGSSEGRRANRRIEFIF